MPYTHNVREALARNRFALIPAGKKVVHPSTKMAALLPHTITDLDSVGIEQVTKLVSEIDAFVFDCDGVLWTGNTLTGDNIVEMIETMQRLNKKVIYVTNNSTKTIEAFAQKFKKFGIDVPRTSLWSSATATARYLQNNFPPGSSVYVIGEPGLHKTLRSGGFKTLGLDHTGLDFDKCAALDVDQLDPAVVAVVVSFDGRICYGKVHLACMYIRYGKAKFIATNRDAFSPLLASGTVVPGGGTFVSAVETASGTKPCVCGKPSSVLASLVLKESGLENRPEKVLMVGDRLDTDILFGKTAGMRSMLVLSGCTKVSELEGLSAESPSTPEFVASSAGVLLKGLKTALKSN